VTYELRAVMPVTDSPFGKGGQLLADEEMGASCRCFSNAGTTRLERRVTVITDRCAAAPLTTRFIVRQAIPNERNGTLSSKLFR
jgi:hypothetical protein